MSCSVLCCPSVWLKTSFDRFTSIGIYFYRFPAVTLNMDSIIRAALVQGPKKICKSWICLWRMPSLASSIVTAATMCSSLERWLQWRSTSYLSVEHLLVFPSSTLKLVWMPASIHCKYFNIWQEKLFGLMSLPTKDQYEELKKRRLHMVRQV